jgi:hypothetical protein
MGAWSIVGQALRRGQSSHLALRRDGTGKGREADIVGAEPKLTRVVAGHEHDGGGDFAEALTRDYSPERAAQASCCDAAGFRHFHGDEPILSRPDQDQA